MPEHDDNPQLNVLREAAEMRTHLDEVHEQIKDLIWKKRFADALTVLNDAQYGTAITLLERLVDDYIEPVVLES